MPDDDDLKRRNQQLAKDLLESLQEPGTSPERAAYEAEKDAADGAALEAYYRRTGQVKDPVAKARSATEMLFAASLLPCPHCETTEAPKLDLVGSGTSWSVTGTCPRCTSRRSHAWTTEGNPLQAKVGVRQLGDERPSAIIRVGQFVSELDRVRPQLPPSPENLQPIEWRASLAMVERALTVLHELLKFVPAGATMIPDMKLDEAEREDRASRSERYQRAWLEGERGRVLALREEYTQDAPRIWALEKPAEPPPSRGALDRPSLTAHAAWVRAGQRGEGRLDVVGFDAKGSRLGGVELSGARLERVVLDHAVIDAVQLHDAELVDVSVRGAVATSLKVKHAHVIRGSFAQAQLAIAAFDGAVIDGTSFEGANLERSTWANANVTAASFDNANLGNAWLDAGRFRGCTFRKADFRLITQGIRCTTRGSVFEDCDLRFTRWDGRDLSGATFVRCKLAGISGIPAALANVRIEDPDLSADGNGSDIGGADDVLALWADS
ncbi:MAG TPA: pentapeptide repeat-containing protein [Kofleriaceae bacterium]|nr:pentapeptide repeat-containing protein [Kofleriaceae bacterium]